MYDQPVASLIEDEFPGEWGYQDAGDGLREALVLRSTNFIDGGLDYSTGARRFIPHAKVDRKRLRRGDLLLEAAGGGPGVPVGRVARFDPPDDRLYVVSNFFRTLRPAPGTDPRFTHHLLDHLYGQPKIWEVQQQTTGIINLKVRDYLQIRVPVPSLEEQRRIADNLDTIDDTIRSTQLVIAKLDAVRSGVLDELTRSVSGVDERSLGDLAVDPLCYGIVQVGAEVSGGVPVVAIRDLGGPFGPGLHRTDPAIEARYPRSRIRGGDVLLSIKGTVGRVGLVPHWFRGNISRDVALIRPVADVDPSFLALFLESTSGQSRLREIAVGTTRAELSIHALRRVKVPVPELSEQERIVGALRSLDQVLHAEHSALDKFRDLRIGLAADLLSGRVRTVAG